MNLKHFPAGVAAFWAKFAIVFALLGAAHAQPRVAFTLDDGPRTTPTPLMSAPERNQAMLKALADHQVQAALFVTINNGAHQPAGLELARAWGQAGHFVANHTMSHPSLDHKSVTIAQFQQELLDCDAVIRQLPGYRPWFRFPYLHEGQDAEKYQAMRQFLAQHKYLHAYVSLDTSDWRLDGALTKALWANPQADVKPFRDAYLDHVWQRAQDYQRISQRLQGRDIAQVLLLHHNLINALFLGDVIAMFKSRGWQIVGPEAAFADPVYQLNPQARVKGQSLLLGMARSMGINVVKEYLHLMDDGDAAMAQLVKAGAVVEISK